jgi:uncharacterized protein YbjQ (UPF0145 family)
MEFKHTRKTYMKNKNMIMTTTSTLDGYQIQQYLGLVSGEVILGANIIRDIAASFTDFLGGRSGAYEKSFLEAKEAAMQELIERATDMGANAIIGIDLDFETIGQNGSMMMVSVSGTAVVVARL